MHHLLLVKKQGYDLQVVYKPGPEMYIAYTLPCDYPLSLPQVTKADEYEVLNFTVEGENKQAKIKPTTATDKKQNKQMMAKHSI